MGHGQPGENEQQGVTRQAIPRRGPGGEVLDGVYGVAASGILTI